MGRILVVDDDSTVRQQIRGFLTAAGHQVLEAGTAEHAIEVYHEHPVDLLILDVILPGMHGFEAVRRLKALSNDELPIIHISVLSDHSSRMLGLRLGADAFLGKPIDRFELESRVGYLLQQKSERAALHRKNAELVEIDRFKEELSTMIVHDLKNPIAVIHSNLDYIAGQLADASPAVIEALTDSQSAGKRVLRLLGNLLDVARIEAHRFELRAQP